MNPCHVLLLIAGLSLLAGCQTTDARGEKPRSSKTDRYEASSFTCQVPEGVSVAIDQGPDYAVHYYRVDNAQKPDGSDVMMGVYEGLEPRQFWNKETDLTVTRRGRPSGKLHLKRGDDIYGVDSKGRNCRESVWEVERPVQPKEGRPFRIPSMVHIWYFGASDDQKGTFDQIAESIEISVVRGK